MRSFDATLAMSMADAQAAVTAALAEQGFGVLTEIDVAATLLAKARRRAHAVEDPGRMQPDLREPLARDRPVGRVGLALQRCARSD